MVIRPNNQKKSQFEEIYNALADIRISDGDSSIKGIRLDNVGDAITQTPIRVLLPLRENDRANVAGGRTLGSGMIWKWSITDVCLFASMPDGGSGIEHWYPQMIRYQENFLSTMFVDNRQLFEGQAYPKIAPNDESLEMGMYEYPSNSGKWYFAVIAEYMVLEAIS